MNKELKRAIRDFRKTFPNVQTIIDNALVMNYNRHGQKQTKKEKQLFLKFSNAVKIIMKADLE